MPKYAMVDDFGLSNIKMHTRNYSNYEKNKILNFFDGCECDAVGGLVTDAISGEMLRKENLSYTKDGFIFDEEDIYHLKKYDAAVTDEFYDHVMKGIN